MAVSGQFWRRRGLLAVVLTVALALGASCSDQADGGDVGNSDATVADTAVEGDTGVTDTSSTAPMDAEDDPADADTEESTEDGFDFDVPEWDTRRPDTGEDGGLADLELKRITPERGPVEGNTPFVIEGKGFTRDTAVFFGSREAEVNFVDQKLVGQTPEATGPGPVTIKALDPASGEDIIEDGYTYTQTLKVDNIQPSRIPTEGGVEVTIEGKSFDADTRVSFDGKTALRHTFVDGETIRVLAPPNEAGPANVRVTNRDESLRKTDAVDYYEELAIDAVRPATGPTAGGTTVTLSGRGFQSGISVTFDGKPATVSSVKSDGTEVTVSTPPHAAGLVDVAVQADNGDATIRSDAFYYRSSASEFRLAAVSPDVAQESGQVDVMLIGSGLDASGLSVDFGGNSATVNSQGPGHATVTIPAHAPGRVDVVARDGQGGMSTLTKGFEYVPDIDVTSVMPSSGDAAGGTNVTIEGEGFTNASRVLFGGVPATFSVADDQTITATTPSHSPGTFDVVVERGDVSAALEDSFTFTEDLELFGFSPVRGSVAGNTYVEIRGRGFTGKLGASFGQNAAKDVQVVDSQTLAVRTPKHQPAAVDVTVTRGSTSETADQQYTYFNPGSRSGGAWGGPIQGAVNVSVYSQGGSPVQGAFVMLSTNPQTTYKGTTDANGLVTLSGPDVYGEQTVTATAPGYSSATVQNVDAENITVFLAPPPSQGPPPPGPPTATFEGKITGLNKIGTPGPNEFHMAMVFATKKSPWSQSPDPGNGNIRMSNGPYTLRTRIGDLALVAVGGLYNSDTQELKPLMMGVKRYQFAAQGKTYQRDIRLDIPLNTQLDFKLKNPPHSPDGPGYNSITPWLDFGFEGVFGQIQIAEGTTDIISADRMPALSGQLSDVSYMAVGGAYTKTMNGALQYPQSVAIKRGIKDTSKIIEMPTLVGVPQIVTPQPGSRPRNNLISWNLNSANRPDFYYVQILTPMQRPVWEAFVPGIATSVRLPDFPDFSHLPPMQRPVPYPGGTYNLLIIGIRHPSVSYSNFSYADLSIDKWEAFSANGHVITF